MAKSDQTFSLQNGQSFTIDNGVIRGAECQLEEDGGNSFGEVLLNHMQNNPSFVGQVEAHTGREDTFGAMVERSIKCASWLRSQNIRPGDVIGICSLNHLDQVIPALAALYVGAIINPWWDYGLTKEVAKFFLEMTSPKLMFLEEEFFAIVSEAIEEMGLDVKIVLFGNTPSAETFEEIIARQEVQSEEFQCTTLTTKDHPAVIWYTSGTTGLPKGALHSHKSLMGSVQLSREIQFSPECRTSFWYTTLCWVSGIISAFASISYPFKKVLGRSYVEAECCRDIEKFKVNYLSMGPSMINSLMKCAALSQFDLSSVVSICCGGAVLRDETMSAICKAFPNAKVFQIYGTTEMGGVAVHQANGYKQNSMGSIGKGFMMKVIDTEDENRILGPNEEGEACFKYPFVMTGYYKNPEDTKRVFDDEGYYHTGDLVYYDEDGSIFIIDRLKEMIKWRQHHVSPVVIEQLIQKALPSVVEAAVVPVPDLEDLEQPLAFVVKLPESDVTEEQIAQVVQDNLPDQMRLRAGIKFLDAMPRTASQKINRRQLKAMANVYARN